MSNYPAHDVVSIVVRVGIVTHRYTDPLIRIDYDPVAETGVAVDAGALNAVDLPSVTEWNGSAEAVLGAFPSEDVEINHRAALRTLVRDQRQAHGHHTQTDVRTQLRGHENPGPDDAKMFGSAFCVGKQHTVEFPELFINCTIFWGTNKNLLRIRVWQAIVWHEEKVILHPSKRILGTSSLRSTRPLA
jgi:hypothetical protein